ncbi:MAG: uracil-DNA glycosylase [Thaumarchaeota archaeon]|nr:uracil-DNA glycosylase [Nitrososphaerota archaeon]
MERARVISLAQIPAAAYVSKEKQIFKLNSQITNCFLCEELVKSRTQTVPGYGDFKAKVLIVGEAPGRFGADITGVPFTKDRSGIFLQKMLNKVGLNLSAPESENPSLKGVFITNIVKCNPRNPDDTNRSPTNPEIKNCMEYLTKEIEIIKPKLIVTLGLPATKFVLGNDFNGKNFGKIKKLQKFSVLPLWHPAFVIRGGGAQRMNEKKYFKYFKKIEKIISKQE